ncbi:MAG: hypothetical protein V8S95_01645 [Odoribacter sp.]
MPHRFTRNFGVGEFDAITLKKLLTGKMASWQRLHWRNVRSRSRASDPERFRNNVAIALPTP